MLRAMNQKPTRAALDCLDAIDATARRMFDVLTGGPAVEHDRNNALQACTYLEFELRTHTRREELERQFELLKTNLDALAARQLLAGDSKTRRLQRVLSATAAIRQTLVEERCS